MHAIMALINVDQREHLELLREHVPEGIKQYIIIESYTHSFWINTFFLQFPSKYAN